MSLPREVNPAAISPPGLPEEKPLEKSRQCPICKVYYKYGNSYWQHVRYVHANFLSQCIICGKSYKRTTMAKQHILHFHKIAWHLCSNYVRKIKKNDYLSENRIKEKLIERRKQNLKYFKKKTLHLISSFNCYDCPGTFTTINELFDHVKEHKNKQETDSEMETEEEDAQEASITEAEETQNGSSSEAEKMENGSTEEKEEMENESGEQQENVPDDSSVEATPNEPVSENENMPNGTVKELEAIRDLLASDDDFEIQ